MAVVTVTRLVKQGVKVDVGGVVLGLQGRLDLGVLEQRAEARGAEELVDDTLEVAEQIGAPLETQPLHNHKD